MSSPGSDSLYRGSLDVHSIPVAIRWRSSSAILPLLETRLGNLEKLGIQRGALGSYVVEKWGFGSEELQEMRETLSNMVSELSPHFLRIQIRVFISHVIKRNRTFSYKYETLLIFSCSPYCLSFVHYRVVMSLSLSIHGLRGQ